MNSPTAHVTPHAPFLIAATGCLAAFGWMVTLGTFHFTAEDSFGSFYDYQAAAWLKGRWDVPEPALSGEAFIVHEKVYGYFGPTPALMRLPLVALDLGFGRVTRLFMLLDYAACLAAVYALLRLACRWREPRANPPAFATVLMTASAGLGSTLFFLGSRAYVYHEAILCGAAFGLWSVYATLRSWQTPTRRWWLVALACGILAVQARPPIGLFALTFLGVIALFARKGTGTARALTIGASAAAGALTFNLVSYIKFGTFDGNPLRFNVQYTDEQLAVLGHRNFHLSNLRFNADAYLLRPALTVSPKFPYLYREYLDRKKYPESRMAYRDQTLAMPWSMPGLFAMALVGSIVAAMLVPPFRAALGLLWLAAIPLGLAMFTAVAVTQRYTADFCPFLIATAAFAVGAAEYLPRLLRRTVGATAALLGVLGVAITLALTLHHQREIVWGVPDESRQKYQQFRTRVDALFRHDHGR